MPTPRDNIPLANVLPHAAPEEPGSHPVNRVFDWVVVLVFVVAIAVPLVGAWRHWDPYGAKAENRMLASFPERPRNYREATRYTDKLFAYFKDHFGFRNTLIHHFDDVRFRLGLLTNNTQVLIGKDGWLFYSQRPDQGYLRERGFDTFPNLDAWQSNLEKRDAYFRARGIVYMVVIGPDKQTIYPEYMPAGLAPVGPSRLDLLEQRLRDTHSRVLLVDPRAVMLAAKGHGLLYWKHDSHWNDYGAWVAYEQVMAAVQAALPQYKITLQARADFLPNDGGKRTGDLVGLLGLDTQMWEPWHNLVRRRPYTGNPATQRAPSDPSKPRLVMFHDSFAGYLFQLMGPHFDHPYFEARYGIDLVAVDRVKPELVVTEMVERTLQYGPANNPKEIAEFKVPGRSGGAGRRIP